MRDPIAWDAELFPLLFAVAGVLVAASTPRRPIGWLMLFIGGCFALSAATLQLLAAGTTTGARWLAWWSERGSAVLVPATLLLVLLLPDGRLPSHAWRPVVRAVVAVQLVVVGVGCLLAGPIATDDPAPRGMAGLRNPIGVLPEAWQSGVADGVAIVLVVPFVLGVLSAAQRVRHPAGDERPRVIAVVSAVLVFVMSVTVPDLAWPGSRQWFHVAGVAVLCATITVVTVRGHYAPVRLAGGSELAASTPANGHVLAALSAREREIMQHLARGATNSEIAKALFISPITVRNHVSSILTKLDVANRTQAVARYLREAS